MKYYDRKYYSNRFGRHSRFMRHTIPHLSFTVHCLIDLFFKYVTLSNHTQNQTIKFKSYTDNYSPQLLIWKCPTTEVCSTSIRKRVRRCVKK